MFKNMQVSRLFSTLLELEITELSLVIYSSILLCINILMTFKCLDDSRLMESYVWTVDWDQQQLM